jgi:hypothetical protein
LIETFWPNDVSLLSIDVMKKGDIGRTVWVVFNVGNLGRYAIFVALEVNHAITALSAAATMASCDASAVVPTAGFLERLKKTLLRSLASQLGTVQDGPAATARRSWFVVLNSHNFTP